MGRNTTGPPRNAPDELHCICKVLQTTTTDDSRCHRPSMAPTLCVGGPVMNDHALHLQFVTL